MPKIGAHISAAKSLHLTFSRAKKIQAGCMQIFITPPQRWTEVPHTELEVQDFKKAAEESGIGPNFIHAIYLVSFGTTNPNHLKKSINWLIYALKEAKRLGVEGIIVHCGSTHSKTLAESLPQITQAINTILKETESPNTSQGEKRPESDLKEIPSPSRERVRERGVPLDHQIENPLLILETAAGAGNLIGDTFKDLGLILKSVNSPRLKVCFDTQHVFASGYVINTLGGLEQTLREFDEFIGLENLAVIHANDSKTDLASRRDRHENIGEGKIGLDGFRRILNHPKLRNIPFILEVPGFDKKGPDLKNIETLKSLLPQSERIT